MAAVVYSVVKFRHDKQRSLGSVTHGYRNPDNQTDRRGDIPSLSQDGYRGHAMKGFGDGGGVPDLDHTIAQCREHVERIELDARMTVREYRNLQAEGIDGLSAAGQEVFRLRKTQESA